MELEIMGLREDIAEVKEMYRAQLNVLLEEKVSQTVSDGMEKPINGSGPAEADPADDGVDDQAPQNTISVES